MGASMPSLKVTKTRSSVNPIRDDNDIPPLPSRLSSITGVSGVGRSNLLGILRNLSRWFNVNSHVVEAPTTFSRVIQLIEIMFIAALATAGIFVQVYTDAEVSSVREQASGQLQNLNNYLFDISDMSILLALEMEPFYEYNTGSYDLFLQKAQQQMRNVDDKLTWIAAWPGDVSELDPNERTKVATPNALRGALRVQRELRKAANGTTEATVLNFYSGIIDSLSLMTRYGTMDAVRFNGWREMLTFVYTFQAYMNFKKYTLVGRKLIAENRTVEMTDPIYQLLIQFYTRYIGFRDIVAHSSPFGSDMIANLTSQEAEKEVERVHGNVLKLELTAMTVDEWNTVLRREDVNINWIIIALRPRVQTSIDAYVKSWEGVALVSVILYAIAGLVIFGGLFLHFFASWRIQQRVVESHVILARLNEAFKVLYDYVPRSFALTLQRGRMHVEIEAPRNFTDTCILYVDIANAHELLNEFGSENLDEFANLLATFYEGLEDIQKRYNYCCFKMDALGDCFGLASGVGEHSGIGNHVVGMLYIALELQELFLSTEANSSSADNKEKTLHLRIGIHVGPCYARLLNLRVYQMGIFGEVTYHASLIHATSLPMKVHCSAAVESHLMLNENEEIELMKRGNLTAGDWSTETFWAMWANYGEERNEQSSVTGGDN